MAGIEDGRFLRREPRENTGTALEFEEINEQEMEAWLDSFELTPEGFNKLSEELSSAGADVETIKKWQWLLIKKIEFTPPHIRPIPTAHARMIRQHGFWQPMCAEKTREAIDYDQILAARKGSQDEFVEKLLYANQEHSAFSTFCERNPRAAFRLMMNIMDDFQAVKPGPVQLQLAYPVPEVHSYNFFPREVARDLHTSGPPEPDPATFDEYRQRAAERGRFYDFLPRCEEALAMLDEKGMVSSQEAQLFCDKAVPFLLARAPYQHLDAYARIMEKAPDYAVAKLMQELHDLTSEETPLAEFHVLERKRYALIGLLCHIELPVAEAQDKKFAFLGRNIELDRFSETAASLERLSSFGEVGVFDTQDKILGYFSIHDLDGGQESAIAQVQDFDEEKVFFPLNEADIPSAKRKITIKSYQEQFHRLGELCMEHFYIPLHTLTLREQLILTYFIIFDKNKTSLVRDATNGNPFITKSCIMTAAYQSQDAFNYTALVHSMHGGYNLHAQHSRGPNIYDRTEDGYVWPDPVDMTITYLDQARSRAEQLSQQLEAKYPDLSIDFQSLVRGLEQHETRTFAAYQDQNPESFVRSQLRTFQELSWGLAAFEEIAGLADRKEPIDLQHYLKQQQVLEKLMSENPEFKRVVIQAMVSAGTLKPKPYLSWTVDRKVEGNSREKISGSSEADTYEARLGAPVFPLLRKLIAAKTTPGPLVVFEPGVGSGAFREEVKKEFGDKVIIVGIADAIYYNPGTYIKNLVDFKKLGVELNETEQNQVGEILYKAIALADGSHHQERVTYDSSRLETIKQNPAAIIDLVAEQLPKLFSTIKAVPDTVCAIDASTGKPETIYPYHLVFSDDQPKREGDVIVLEKVRQALKELQVQSRQAIVTDDPLLKMPIRAEGVLMGDFDTISKMVTSQFDFSLDARALVYKRDKDWIKIMEQLVLASKMGVWSDSVRDNEGYRYRLEELRILKEKLGSAYRIYVIQGSGFKREDFSEGKNVPLSCRISPKNIAAGLMTDTENFFEVT